MSTDSQRRSDVSRRHFLGGGAAALGGTALAASLPAAAAGAAAKDVPGVEVSTFFATAFVEYYGSHPTDSDGDLWANCWADDDAVYAANGDGKGFDTKNGVFADTVVNRIDGTPATGITGVRLAAGAELGPIWDDPAQYNRKPTGMACVDGVLYLAMQDLKYGDNAFNESPTASISRSDDHGKTWRATAKAMFPNSRFSTLFFLDFGRNHENARRALGARDGDYVYAYGLDWNWRDSYGDVVQDPTRMYLGRVPRTAIQDRARWEFFAGADRGRPRWDSDIIAKVPVLDDPRREYPTIRNPALNGANLSVISQGGVVYNAPLRRYLYTSWTEYTFEFYESPTPWGPWRLFLHHDAGGYPWYGNLDGNPNPGPKNGGYGTSIPSKFISADGTSMWVQSNYFVGNAVGRNDYQFNLRRLRVVPAGRSARSHHPTGPANLARADGVTPTEKSAHYGHWEYYNDGDATNSEDSFDQSNKDLDWWGYLWPRSHQLARVVYTTGKMFPDGGWFTAYDGGLRVQVRRNFQWVDVADLQISPDYPYDNTAGPMQTYTLRFRPTTGDGIRIVGPPGGASYFTSIAELEVYSDH
ncbi:MAG: DUF4185 domain-containing protein [Mycobacteriales bacterium]